MKRLLPLLFFALCFFIPKHALATNQSPTQSYCMAWAALSGQLIYNWEAPLALSAGCGVQYGDFFTDGPLYNPAPGTSGLTFTVPANTWIAQGQKVVVTTSTNLTLANNTNNWVWLDCNSCSGVSQGTFESTTTSTPPHSYSTLVYVAVTSSGSITAYTPTLTNTLLASGWLQIVGDTSTGVNRALIEATNATSCCQVVLYTQASNLNVGTTPIRVMDDATDCVTGAAKNAFDVFNHSNAALLTIGCSDTGSVMNPTIHTTGNMIVGGAFTDNTSVTNGGLSTSTKSALCGDSADPESQCFNGIPVPLATATPLAFNNSGAATSGSPSWSFDDTDPQCTESGTHQNGYIFRIRSDTPTDIFHESCAGNATFSNLGTTLSTSVAAMLFQMTGSNQCDLAHNPTNLIFNVTDDIGVSDLKLTCGGTITLSMINTTNIKVSSLNATALPVIGSSSTSVTSANIGAYLATPNPGPTASAATGVTPNTYVQAETSSVTLGTSYGTQGKWLGVVEADFWVTALTSGAPVYGCIESSSTVTTQALTYAGDNSNVICRGSPSGAQAGTYLFGNGTTPAYEEIPYTHARWVGTAANGATVTFTTNVAGTSSTSITVFTNLSSHWIPI